MKQRAVGTANSPQRDANGACQNHHAHAILGAQLPTDVQPKAHGAATLTGAEL